MAGAYISYPFCAQKCSFCNFASGAFSRELESKYTSALRKEIASHEWVWTPDTIYLGGGTPSNFSLADLESVLNLIPGRPWREATIEAAPGSITREKAQIWHSLGITRVSLGVQSFVPRELARTGRRHTAEIVAADCDILRSSGITDLNLDLIAGLPHQTPKSWGESLDWIARLNPSHVSVYMFEVDEDSRLGFEILNNGTRYDAAAAPTDDLSAELYETAVDRLTELGISRYEISNFAKPGYESLHNWKYWTMAPYVGFGSDAHSFDGKVRKGGIEAPTDYVEAMLAGRSPSISVTESHFAEERIFTGLRLTQGVRLTGHEWEHHRDALLRFIDAGLLEADGDNVRLTRRGVLLSNEVFQEFIAA